MVPLFALLFLAFQYCHFALAQTDETNTPTTEKAIFASGCFWKPQFLYSKEKGVLHTEVGYCGGTVEDPSYEQVCEDNTGHAEAVLVEFDPAQVSYSQLVRKFFSIHDPTTRDRQGADVGSQYRSVIFYLNEEQHKTALEVKDELEKSKSFDSEIVTKIEPAGKFWKAEDYHQDYFKQHGQVCE
ncbi:MAG: peptide-methionine (S)-S-oxide reductase MsrA [Cyanobacteria bacterium]|nr:peptide-methionine (S)-S-oxide reductase MsrA [Cyanobacteriota bacterium]